MIYFNYPNGKFFILKRNKGDYKKIDLKDKIITPKNFNIKYPFINNLKNDKTIDNINNSISNKVMELLREQVFIPENINFDEVIGEYTIYLNNKGLVSILFSLYTYVNKAAHGYTSYNSITFDANTGQVYEFSDLFNSKLNYVPMLNEIIEMQIKQQHIPFINDYNGVEKDQKFYLTDKSLVLYYPVYEYTPYSYGLFKIDIPYSKMENLLGPVSPIQILLK